MVFCFDILGKEWFIVDEVVYYCGSCLVSFGRMFLILVLFLGILWVSSFMRRVNCIGLFIMLVIGLCVGVLVLIFYLLY